MTRLAGGADAAPNSAGVMTPTGAARNTTEKCSCGCLVEIVLIPLLDPADSDPAVTDLDPANHHQGDSE